MIENKANAKRERIISATIKLSQQSDFRGVSIREICRAADISIGTFYKYFQTKEELLNSILIKIDQYLLENVVQHLVAQTEADNLRLYTQAFALDTRNTGNLFGGTISNSFIPLPSTPEGIEAEGRRPLYRIPRDIIRRGQEKGEFSMRFTPEDLTGKLIMILRGASIEWNRRDFSFDILVYIQELTEMYLQILLAV